MLGAWDHNVADYSGPYSKAHVWFRAHKLRVSRTWWPQQERPPKGSVKGRLDYEAYFLSTSCGKNMRVEEITPGMRLC